MDLGIYSFFYSLEIFPSTVLYFFYSFLNFNIEIRYLKKFLRLLQFILYNYSNV